MIIRGFLFLFVIAFLIAGPALLSRLDFWRIKNIEVNNNEVITAENVKSNVFQLLTGHYLWVFPHDNILLYPKSKIEKSLLDSFPRLSSVKVSMKSFNSISVQLKERSPSALWCLDSGSNGEDCYFIDATGLVFDKAPIFTNNVYVVFTGNLSDDPINKQYVKEEEFKIIEDFVATLKTLSFSPAAVKSLENGDYSIKLSTDEVIIFTTQQSLDQTVSNFKSVLSDPKLNLFSSGSLSVSSIDLRFGNKVFYKQKEK